MSRRIVPQSVKRRLKLAGRAWADARSGTARRFAKPAPLQRFPHTLCLAQPILNATDEQSRVNKIHNIKVAAASIETVQINPGQIFSFWHIVKAPSQKNNFRRGINIINDKVVEDFGGGLCQLSGIIYHVCLKAGLSILERTNHSVDLYHDQQRYTPLGADCAVFYGYKDLRFRNDHPHPVRFSFQISDRELVCRIESPEPLKEKAIIFQVLHDDESGSVVNTVGDGGTLARSIYKKHPSETSERPELSMPQLPTAPIESPSPAPVHPLN